MSNTPGISPITTDIEEVRHSEEDGYFGEGNEKAEPSPDGDEGETDPASESNKDRGRMYNP